MAPSRRSSATTTRRSWPPKSPSTRHGPLRPTASPPTTGTPTLGNPQVAPRAQHPRLMAVDGGYPLIANGHVIGALGISGGTCDQDQAAAETALSAIGFDIPA
ncbi:heme-binding protein [Streptomyces sp. NBC_01724]